MPLFRRRKMQATINTTKHYVHHSPFSVAAGSLTRNLDIDAVALSSVDAFAEVRAGAVVKAIYIELWMFANSVTAQASFNITVEKTKGGQPIMTFTQANNLGSYPNKANILYTTQGLVGNEGQNQPLPILKQWIAIPKGKQRFANGDQLRVNIAAITTGVQLCGISIYKEYY